MDSCYYPRCTGSLSDLRHGKLRTPGLGKKSSRAFGLLTDFYYLTISDQTTYYIRRLWMKTDSATTRRHAERV